ncbi:MAG: hypothetical protein KF901_20470 [Myxococcales bacterium]|nr:hypothetical protein [Myxococcales bacterium]
MRAFRPLPRSWALALALLALSSPAGAQDLLGQAEEAYMNVDFERTLELCGRAMASGSLSPERLARVYELMGIAHAANGDEDASREAYKKMLALRPDAQVDTNLAPRLRSPFMEARGYWATRSDRLSLEAVLVRAERGLRVTLSDPLGMVASLVVLTRGAGELRPYDEHRGPAQLTSLVEVAALPEADRIEYVIEALDAAGNRVAQLGTRDTPNSVGRDTPRGGERGVGGGEERPRRWWIAGVVAAIVVGAALGVGLYYGLRTEPVTLQSQVVFR